MKTKKITAPTITEAMGKVKKELGPDAVILYTKKIRKTRFFPPFKKEMVEIVAALDEEPTIKVDRPQLESPSPKNKGTKESFVSQALDDRVKEQPTQYPKEMPPLPSSKNLEGSELLGTAHLFPDAIKRIYHQLIENDFNPKMSDHLTKGLLKEWYSSSNPLGTSELKNKLSYLLKKQLGDHPFTGRQSETKLITLVGPTGVGKTTTAAKIASKAVLEEEKKVAFITTDTYRIAAVDQLKTYAKILNIPISVVYTSDDFREAIETYQTYDLIVVDSAGRNFQQKKYVNELSQLIPFQDQMETYLVLSATSKIQDLERITNQFSSLPLSSFLFTKLDETLSIGNLCQLVMRHPYGVTYFTNGQDVPDDILEADRDAFIQKLIEGIIHE